MASTYPDEGPLPWFRVEMSIFYIVFFVVFPFFFVNIFVALIIVTFNELGEAELQDDMDKNQVQLITLNHYGNHKLLLKVQIYHIIHYHHVSFIQKSCISFAIEAKPLELYVPPDNHGIRYHIWRLVTSGPFENIIMLLIIGNTVLLMLKVK